MRDHTGPPYPSPSPADVRRMPADTEEQRALKRAAAERCLRQLCERARFVLQVTDLRSRVRTEAKCGNEVDLLRPLIPPDLLERILSGP